MTGHDRPVPGQAGVLTVTGLWPSPCQEPKAPVSHSLTPLVPPTTLEAAADEVSQKEPTVAFKLEHEALAKLEKIGVKVVKTVDKSGFMAVSKPIQDKLASDLGPNAVKVLGMVRNVQ